MGTEGNVINIFIFQTCHLRHELPRSNLVQTDFLLGLGYKIIELCFSRTELLKVEFNFNLAAQLHAHTDTHSELACMYLPIHTNYAHLFNW